MQNDEFFDVKISELNASLHTQSDMRARRELQKTCMACVH